MSSKLVNWISTVRLSIILLYHKPHVSCGFANTSRVKGHVCV